MQEQEVKILLQGLRKTCSDHAYSIEQVHWAHTTDNYESEYILCIIPKAPAEASRRVFKNEEELFSYIEALIGETNV